MARIRRGVPVGLVGRTRRARRRIRRGCRFLTGQSCSCHDANFSILDLRSRMLVFYHVGTRSPSLNSFVLISELFEDTKDGTRSITRSRNPWFLFVRKKNSLSVGSPSVLYTWSLIYIATISIFSSGTSRCSYLSLVTLDVHPPICVWVVSHPPSSRKTLLLPKSLYSLFRFQFHSLHDPGVRTIPWTQSKRSVTSQVLFKFCPLL